MDEPIIKDQRHSMSSTKIFNETSHDGKEIEVWVFIKAKYLPEDHDYMNNVMFHIPDYVTNDLIRNYASTQWNDIIVLNILENKLTDAVATYSGGKVEIVEIYVEKVVIED